MRIKLTLLALAFVAMFACTEEYDSITVKSKLTSEVSSTSSSGEVSITVTDTGAWSAVSADSWCEIPSEYSSGTGATTIKATLEANTTGAVRFATVTITGDSSITTVIITQGVPSEAETAISVDADDTELTFIVDEVGAWSIVSSASWAPIPDEYTSGEGEVTITMPIEANSGNARSATITVTAESYIETITVSQGAAEGFSDGEQREITLIFHTIYDGTDSKQYLSVERVAEIIAYMNTIYNQSSNNMNIQFSAATTDPDGNALSEVGIERIKLSTATIDAQEFMMDMSNDLVADHLWDLDRYVNVYSYTFEGDVALGISFMPYSLNSDPIDGLVAGDYYLDNNPTYLHGVHLNTNYSDVDITSDADPFKESLYDCDFKVSAAHEVGHYLGLHHPFTESSDSSCSGDDYCDDTPNYDRATYESYIAKTMITSVDQLFDRTACDGTAFVATNIMDYGYNWYEGFSSDQNTRVNSVLDRGVLVPGYKALASKATKGATVRPEPVMVVCSPR